MPRDYHLIVALLEKYFDLLYYGDTALIPEVFLPSAHVYTVAADEVVDVDLDGFRQRIANRPAPAKSNEDRRDRILAIDQLGPTTALAKVDLLILPSGYYADYLSLLKINDQWKIASKVFHFEAS